MSRTQGLGQRTKEMTFKESCFSPSMNEIFVKKTVKKRQRPTEHAIICPKPHSITRNRTRASNEKAKLTTFWPSDDNDSSNDELQQYSRSL